MSIVTETTRLIHTETGNYPVYLSELSKLGTGTIFASTIEEEELLIFGYEVVHDVAKPTEGVSIETAPVTVDGVWYRTWQTRPFTEEEIALRLSEAKEALKAEGESKRISSFEKGFPHVFGEETYHVQLRSTDRQNITALRLITSEAVEAGQAMPIKFRVWENVNVILTAEEMVALANKSFLKVSEAYDVIWTFKDQVDAATTLEELPRVPAEIFTL